MNKTAKEISIALSNYYVSAKYVVPNIYLFDCRYHETDLLVVKHNGIVYDVEIKLTRADFKNDLNKIEKHKILQGLVECERPNRFYYAVPTGLIQALDVPAYSGLLYVDEFGAVKKIKEAPQLTKDKVQNIEKRMCNKFYYAFLELQKYKNNEKVKELEKFIRAQEKEINRLTEEKKLIQKLYNDEMRLQREERRKQ